MIHLLLHLLRGTDGVGDFGLEEFAIALAEPVNGGFDRAFIHAERGGQICIGLRFTQAGQCLFESVEQGGFSFALIFGFKLQEHCVQKSGGPLAIEGFVGRVGGGGFEMEATLCGIQVERKQPVTAAALLRLALGPLAGKEMIHRAEQVGAEAALFARRTGDGIGLEQTEEKGLCKVLRVVR